MPKHHLLKKKRRHHHVWQHYLRPWTIDGQLFVRQDGNVRPSGTNVVAVEKDFYKMSALSELEIAFIRREIIDKSHPYAKRLHLDFLELLTRPIKFIEMFREVFVHRGLDPDEVIDAYMTNALEDHHMTIEHLGIPVLDAVLKGDLAFYSDDELSISFLHFVSVQYMRTKGIKEKMFELMREDGVGIEKIWDIVSLMAAVNVGSTLYKERSRREIKLAKSCKEQRFITGDQPVTNLFSGEEASSKFSLYYPVSPYEAILLEEPGAEVFPRLQLTSEEVIRLNRRMAEAHHLQLFSKYERCFEGL